MVTEPLIHSHITDCLPVDHPLAFETIYCACPNCACQEMLHAGNNECMQTWVETGKGTFCVPCFDMDDTTVLDGGWALDD